MFIELVRLGRDAEVRITPQGKSVANLACAYDYGYGQNKKTQWIDLALWGDRADKLGPSLLKGTQLFVVASDLAVSSYQKADGITVPKLSGNIVELKFAGSKQEERPAPPPPAQRRPAPPPPQQQPSMQYDDMDSDIPFS